jgi:hypothetical protein
MLEALLFKVQGKILKWGPVDGGLWESVNADPFTENPKGRPIFIRKAIQTSENRIDSLKPRVFGPIVIESAMRRPAEGSESCLTCEDERFGDYSPYWHTRRR